MRCCDAKKRDDGQRHPNLSCRYCRCCTGVHTVQLHWGLVCVARACALLGGNDFSNFYQPSIRPKSRSTATSLLVRLSLVGPSLRIRRERRVSLCRSTSQPALVFVQYCVPCILSDLPSRCLNHTGLPRSHSENPQIDLCSAILTNTLHTDLNSIVSFRMMKARDGSMQAFFRRRDRDSRRDSLSQVLQQRRVLRSRVHALLDGSGLPLVPTAA